MNHSRLALALLAAALATGCVTQQTKTDDAAPAAKSAEKPAEKAPEPKSTAGLNDKGEVVDSSKIQCGNTSTKVKGINDREGELIGKMAAGSKFGKLKVGMGMKQVTDLIGQPSDQGAYMTGKAWIPFYFGGDRHRYEMVYKNTGRLIFAGGSVGDWGSGYLICVVHNRNEPAYR